MTDDTASKRKSRRVLDRETARLIVHTDVRDASDLAAAIEGVISTGNIVFLTSVEPVMMSFPQPHTWMAFDGALSAHWRHDGVFYQRGSTSARRV